ncbi:hypothetical protein [Streptomyces sp. NPDC001153]
MGDDDGGDDFIRSLLEHIPDVVWHVLRPLLEDAFRWGKVAEVYPFPQQHYLNSLSQDWADMTMSLGTTEGNLTSLVSGITQQTNSEWYDAMREFCSSLWGTTAWGKHTGNYEWGHDSASSPTATHPVMTVLFDTAKKISDLLREFAEGHGPSAEAAEELKCPVLALSCPSGLRSAGRGGSGALHRGKSGAAHGPTGRRMPCVVEGRLHGTVRSGRHHPVAW